MAIGQDWEECHPSSPFVVLSEYDPHKIRAISFDCMQTGERGCWGKKGGARVSFMFLLNLTIHQVPI